MASTGTYALESTVNYEAWLKAVGIPAEIATIMSTAKPTLEVTKAADGITVKTIVGDKTFTNTAKFGVDSPTDIAGLEYTINVKSTASGYTGSITLEGKSGTVTVEECAKGFTQTLVVDGVTAKKIYIKK